MGWEKTAPPAKIGKPMSEEDNYQIILEKMEEKSQPDAALFLSGCFSLPPGSTRGIAASGPIVLLSGMSKWQAESILSELNASIPEGVVLRLAAENVPGKYSRLQWPRPPRIYGRDLGEFADRQECVDTTCPLCGGALRIAGNGVAARLLAGECSRRGISERQTLSPSDKDPLFSGIKPLATADTNFASLRSLEAGDTGFWMDYHDADVPEPGDKPAAERSPGSESTARKSTNKTTAGLAAFMKPGVFAVVVGRTKDPQAVKMVSEIMGVSEDEARDKCMSLGLCVVKGVALDEAQKLLARFHNLRARARIVRPA